MTTHPRQLHRKTRKAENTRAAILEAALDLFRERGYEQTTMRAIAERAGVALGNAYYYFHSKEHLIQAFYDRTQDEQRDASRTVLERERDLKDRLLGVMNTKIRAMEPYHQFAGKLFKIAGDPQSPLSPFSDESDPVRRDSIQHFAQVIDGSSLRIPKDLKADLPYLLWLYHMGIIMYWVHDTSPGQAKTYKLVAKTVEIVVRLIKLASHPLMRPLRKSMTGLLAELREELS
jgi:AcrR family transcriptional regulator